MEPQLPSFREMYEHVTPLLELDRQSHHLPNGRGGSTMQARVMEVFPCVPSGWNFHSGGTAGNKSLRSFQWP